MAKMNILRGGFEGSVGKTTGTYYKGKPINKSKIWKRKPNTTKQGKALTAFTLLIRYTSIVSRDFVFTQVKKHKNMTQINGITKLFAEIMTDSYLTKVSGTKFQDFNLSKLQTLYTPDVVIPISMFTYYLNPLKFEITIDPYTIPPTATDYKLMLYCIDSSMKLKYKTEIQPEGLHSQFKADCPASDAMYLNTLGTVTIDGKQIFTGWNLLTRYFA